jgi:fatty-acyl-CoA synthase
MDIRTGDRIATLAWNDYRHLELYYAISCYGAVCHTVNPRLFPEQIEFILNHAEDRVVFVDPMFVPALEQMAGKLASVEKFVVLAEEANMPDCDLPGVQSYETFIGSESTEIDWPELDENAACALCYTSGTTGDPKGVLYSHRSTVLHAYASALPDVMNISVRDVMMPVVPMFHVNAWGIPYAAVLAGAKLVFPGPKMIDGPTLEDLIFTEGVTFSAGVPTIWMALLAHLRESGGSIDSLDRVIVGGAACPGSVIEEFREKHAVECRVAWGLTETSPLGTVNTPIPEILEKSPDETLATRCKQGRPICGVDLRLIGEDGTEQPWDGVAVGEINVRGPWVCSSYYNSGIADSHTDDGWFRTGDVANVNPEGYVQITDRSKDVIKSGGEWISSIDLENTAVGHSAVAEAAVIGLPHPRWTERPLLVIVREPNVSLDAAEILTYLEGKVAKFWIPDDAVFTDELPHTATGKISKKDLREAYKDYRFPENRK